MLGKNIGVIGCGYRMREMIRLLLQVNSDHKIIEVYDPDKNSIKKLEDELGYTIKISRDYQKVSENPKIDWVFIGSINAAHKEHIISAIKNNKNIFCEKPIAISLEECKEIMDFYEKNKIIFFISYPLKYSPLYKKIKEFIDKEEIGDIVGIECNETLSFNHGSFIMTDWRRFEELSGGHLLEKCCHDIAIIIWLVGNLPKKIASFGGLDIFKEKNSQIYDDIKNTGEKLEFNDKKTPNPFVAEKDIVDNQVAIIEFFNGVKLTFHTNCSSGIPERRIYICGTKGTLRGDLATGTIEFRKVGSTGKISQFHYSNNNTSHGGGDLILVKELNNALLYNKPTTHIDDAIKSAVTCILIDKARKEKKIIDLTPFWDDLNINY